MKVNIKLIVALIVVVIFGLFVYFASTENKEDGLREVKVGVSKGGSVDSVIDYGIEKGFFKERGIKIEKIEADQNIAALLNSGEVDIVVNRMVSSMVPFLNNEETVLLAIFQQYPSDSFGVSRFPLSEIGSVKKVGVNRLGGAHHFSIIPILEKHGIDAGAVEFVITGPSPQARLAMLQKGEIDFAMINQVEISGIEDQNLHLISPPELHGDVFVPNGAVSNRENLKNKSQEIELFLEALHSVAIHIENNKNDYSEFLAQSKGMTAQESRDSAENLVKSRENVSFIPKKEDLKKLRDIVVGIAEPKNPTRDLGEFIFPEFASRIER